VQKMKCDNKQEQFSVAKRIILAKIIVNRSLAQNMEILVICRGSQRHSKFIVNFNMNENL